jgi:c-di-GMP-binding flagellar brake protein YcgR
VYLQVEGFPERLPCRVDAVDGDALVLVPELGEGADPAVASKTAATVEWASRRGRIRRAGRAEPHHLRTVLVELEPDMDVVQSREHVRATLPITVQLELADGSVQGKALDVSGGGMRVQLAGGSAPADGERLHVMIELEGGAIAAAAEVVASYGGDVYGLRFVSIEDRDRDRLIRYVFDGLRIATQYPT